MTNEELKTFYTDLSEVLGKFNVRGLVGMWFEYDAGHGVLQLYHPVDGEMKEIVEAVATVLVDINSTITGQTPEIIRAYIDKNAGEIN